jgi:hypothetical protein
MMTSISPIRRKGTTVVESANPLKKNLTAKAPTSKNAVQQKSMRKTENTGSRGNLEVEKKEDEDHEELPPQVEAGVDDTVTHKKKRKRNVESRDVWTQTDRSDYMLIKYRQKQKQAIQLAKSQKCKLSINDKNCIVTKEEQALYEQALQYHKAQLMSKAMAQDVP